MLNKFSFSTCKAKTPLGAMVALLLMLGLSGCDEGDTSAAGSESLSGETSDNNTPPPAGSDQPSAPAGEVTERHFSNEAGDRRYFLYVPTGGGVGAPLMVWLHGCAGPGTMEAGHALTVLAEEMNFVLAYPIQEASHNPAQCWNWFLTDHQQRGSGEPAILAGITTALMAEFSSDQDRIYLGGYSAGGAMTTVMGATYPELYAAIAPSAGSPYAFDPTGQRAFEAMGDNARLMPSFVLQGVLDEISLYPIGRTVMTQWLGANDYVDDGEANNSVSRLPTGATTPVVDTALPSPLLAEDYYHGDCHIGVFLTSPYDHFINGLFFYEDSGLALQRLMMDFLFEHSRAEGSDCS